MKSAAESDVLFTTASKLVLINYYFNFFDD